VIWMGPGLLSAGLTLAVVGDLADLERFRLGDHVAWTGLDRGRGRYRRVGLAPTEVRRRRPRRLDL
jgi:hypothetical protein